MVASDKAFDNRTISTHLYYIANLPAPSPRNPTFERTSDVTAQYTRATHRHPSAPLISLPSRFPPADEPLQTSHPDVPPGAHTVLHRQRLRNRRACMRGSRGLLWSWFALMRWIVRRRTWWRLLFLELCYSSSFRRRAITAVLVNLSDTTTRGWRFRGIYRDDPLVESELEEQLNVECYGLRSIEIIT